MNSQPSSIMILATFSIIVLTACGLGTEVGNGKKPKDEPTEKSTANESLPDDSVANEMSTPDVAESGASNDTTPTANTLPSADVCDWRVMESHPVQVVGDCVAPAGAAGSVVYELKEAPDEVTLRVSIDGSVLLTSAFVYDETFKTLTVNDPLVKGGARIHIQYSGRDSTSSLTRGVLGKVVDARGLDGCTWLIRLQSGDTIQTPDLGTEFRAAGLAVTVKYEEQATAVGICMTGKIVKLQSVTKAGP